MSTLHNRAYYDAFSERYDRRRKGGYHGLLDELESSLVLRYARGGDVLEAGCGTGLILERLRPHCRSVVGIDLSAGMLSKARERGFHVAQSNILELPFRDASFDVVCCFKVLAHVEHIDEALAELGRVVKPGGHLVVEFYNPLSIRGLMWNLKRPGQVALGLHEKNVFVRFDTPEQAQKRLPANFSVVDERGARVLTVIPQAHRIPLFGSVLGMAEKLVADPLARLGSFYSLVARREA